MPLHSLKLEVFSSTELMLEEMKTLGAKCSTGGTREALGPKDLVPTVAARCSFESW